MEAIFLVCGAGGPQLKRNPLGGALVRVPMPYISTKAILVGSLVDLGGSTLASLVYTVVLTAILFAQGVPQADVANRILADPSYYVATLIFGFPFLAAGGFVAAPIARAAELVHALIVGAIGLVIGLVFVLLSDTTKWPSWYIPVSFAITPPIALLGGYLAKRRAASPSRAA